MIFPTLDNAGARRSFLILHGLDGSPEGHWQHWLAGELASRGHDVCFPEFPTNENPNLLYWLGLLHLELLMLEADSTILAHSLGAYLWLHYASLPGATRAGRVLLVAPPGVEELRDSRRVRHLPESELVPTRIHSAAREILLVSTERDPYCAAGAENVYARPLGLRHLSLPSWAGHVNVSSGFGEWRAALEWSLGAGDEVLAATGAEHLATGHAQGG